MTAAVGGVPARTGRRRSLLWLGFGVSGLVLSALAVRPDHVSGEEAAAFRLVNDVAWLPYAPVWALMQLGNFVAVPVSAGVALAARRPRLAGGLAAGGVLVYVLAKVVKRLIVRGRPARLLSDVVLRGAPAGGLGYVSGHAAVVALMAVVAAPRLPRPARIAAVVAAVLVCLARVWVGAHLPLDVVGGAALGLAVGGLVRLASVDRRAPEPEGAAACS